MAFWRFAFPVGLPAAVLVLFLTSTSSDAQLPGRPVHDGSGPVSDISTNVGAGSGPVRGAGGSLRSLNAGSLSGNPVRGSVSGDVLSGPVSDASVGPVTSGRAVTGGGSVGQSSAGAVTKDVGSPLGERIAEPLRDLGPLQDELRELQPLPRETPVPGEALLEEAPAAVDETEAAEAEPVEPAELGVLEPYEAATDDQGEVAEPAVLDEEGDEVDQANNPPAPEAGVPATPEAQP